MPAFKDIQWNQNPSTTALTITIPVPTNVLNDLLIVIITADTYDATGGFTTNAVSQGWTLIHQTTNTALQFMAYKFSSGAEPASYTFTSTDTETYNGCILSISEVNTTNPFGNPAVRSTTNSAATAKVTMNQITTNVPNSLILYAISSSVAGVPSLLEGPVVGILAADGAAESTGVGWGFKASTGLTSGAVIASAVAAGAGVKTTLQIAPPAGGATIIPAYPSADNAIYINPLNGTTAYNADTAVAATADTNYGTSIGGLTAGDAGLAAVTDAGINSFHSVARLTSANNSVNPSGVELVIAAANRPNVAGKNILCHVGPSTEGQLQRFSSIASTRGIWFGMRSATGAGGGATAGWKIWQVYGAERGSLRHQPIVINEASTTTRATSGTLDPLVVTSFAWWVSGTGVGTTIWDIATLWAVSTSTVAGGSSTTPVDIPGIATAISIGKERKSAIQQGSGQLILYQPIQFGDGGTSPIYLNLNATAIEFPTQFNRGTKNVQYNSVDNFAGITYDAGPSDTIIHTNASVSSQSRYDWRFDPGFVTTSTYDFSGLSVIGAGDIQLIPGLTLTEVSFNNYVTIAATGATFTECSFSNLPNSSTAISLSNTTTFDMCEISTISLSTGTAFARVSDPTIFTDCTFNGSNITGHALEIISTGTFNFSGNIFTGYGGVGGSNTVTNSGSTSAAIYNNSGGLVTLNILNNGSGPSVRNGINSTTIISNPQTFIVRNIQPGTELRLFTQDTLTELAGAEVVGPTPSGENNLTVASDDQNSGKYKVTYAYEYTADTPIFIVAHSLAYQWLRQSTILDTNGGDVSIVQLIDRQYDFGSSP